MSKPAGERLLALDAFRGLTMAAMVIVNNPGDWGHVYAPLLHAEWHGCTPTDLVFPFFLFIVGVAITLSRKTGRVSSMIRRAVVLVALGWLLNLFPRFDIAHMRIPGVLQRIGLCYLAAALIYRWAVGQGSGASAWPAARRIALVASATLVAYWALLMTVPGESGVRGDLTPDGNIGAVLDRALMDGHLWKPRWDPEGLLSTIPAIGTTLLGLLAGLWLRVSAPGVARLRGLVLGGAAAAALGLAWSIVFPLNKSLWTSSYAMYTAGLASLFLGACYLLIDLRGWRRAAYPSIVLGSNAIALYVLSGLLATSSIVYKVTLEDGSVVAWKTWVYRSLFEPLASAYNASLLYALANLVVLYAVLWVMYKRGIFLKV